MKELRYTLEVNKKGQVTIPKTLREVADIQEESFINISYNKETDKIEICKSDNKFNEFTVNFIKANLLVPTHRKVVVFISGVSGSGKTTLVKEITRGLKIDGIKGKSKEHYFDDEGEVFVIDDIHDKTDYTNQDKINDLKGTIITSQIEIKPENINHERDRLYIYVSLGDEKRGIKSVHLSQNGYTIEWKW